MNNLELLKVYNFDNKIRLGARFDGGYIYGGLDNEVYDCYISAGVFNEESFTRAFISDNNMNEFNSYAFDGTIDRYPYEYTNKIAFIKKNIGGINDENTTNLFPLFERYNNIFIKMDIEGGEYPWLQSMNENKLKKIKQIVIEFHGLTDDGFGCKYEDKIKCLEKLANTHYIIHAHGNNCGDVVNGFPDVLELTYVNKDYFAEEPPRNRVKLPIPNFDFPNDSTKDEIDLYFSY
uniref:Methyltransferase FkbM domain-containing protein n=1 Tax=viral metagenome TaxID=1070528 RepID=A0A6C0DQN7_9ZZZZ